MTGPTGMTPPSGADGNRRAAGVVVAAVYAVAGLLVLGWAAVTGAYAFFASTTMGVQQSAFTGVATTAALAIAAAIGWFVGAAEGVRHARRSEASKLRRLPVVLGPLLTAALVATVIIERVGTSA